VPFFSPFARRALGFHAIFLLSRQRKTFRMFTLVNPPLCYPLTTSVYRRDFPSSLYQRDCLQFFQGVRLRPLVSVLFLLAWDVWVRNQIHLPFPTRSLFTLQDGVWNLPLCFTFIFPPFWICVTHFFIPLSTPSLREIRYP